MVPSQVLLLASQADPIQMKLIVKRELISFVFVMLHGSYSSPVCLHYIILSLSLSLSMYVCMYVYRKVGRFHESYDDKNCKNGGHLEPN